MNKITSIACRVLNAPFAMCERRVARMGGPVKHHIDAYESRGEDLCAAVWNEYVRGQRKLLPYRVNKFTSECAHIMSGNIALATSSLRDWVLLLRFGTKCMFVFILFTMVGRRSVYPPISPRSAFVEELVRSWQPNHVRAFPREISDSVTLMQANCFRDMSGEAASAQH